MTESVTRVSEQGLPAERAQTFELKKLSPKHKTALSLLAQGLGRQRAAEIAGFTPEYLTMLLQQPLCKDYIEKMSRAVDAQLQSLYAKSVDVLAEAMEVGNMDEKLRGAQTVLKAVGKDKVPEQGSGTVVNVQIGIVR